MNRAVLAGVYIALAATAAIAVGESAGSAPAAPEVHIAQGVLRGTWQAPGLAVFQAIPYAAAPVGDLRWKPPQAPATWQGVRDATSPPSACMQVNWGWNANDAQHDSEDCLYLNVASPSLHAAHPLPVIFWIHGGANYNGSGSYPRGQTLTQHGVVLVSINYRLGVFGFLALPELTRESPHHASGNYAVLDQIAALRWVRENIGQFGGDPQNITIAGQSAGAIDVGMLLATPAGRGLFTRAIAESGGPITPTPILPSLRQGEALGESFATFAGATITPARLATLRKLPAADLLDAANRYTAPDKEGVPSHQGPSLIIDGWVLPIQPAAALRAGQSHPVPLLIGNNIQEFSLSGSSVISANQPRDPVDTLKRIIAKDFGTQAPGAMVAYGLARSDVPPADPQLGSIGTQLMTDTFFRCPARIAGEWLAARSVPVWEYQFERPLPGTGQSSTRHSGELPYVFGWAQISALHTMGATFSAEDAHLSEAMQGYWTNFAKSGNPNGPTLPEWPEFREPSPVLMHFKGTGPFASPLAQRSSCDLLKSHIDHELGGPGI